MTKAYSYLMLSLVFGNASRPFTWIAHRLVNKAQALLDKSEALGKQAMLDMAEADIWERLHNPED